MIEKWGRGTNRVISMCREAGVRPPEFEEVGPSAVVSFKVNVLGPAASAEKITAPITAPVTAPVLKLLSMLAEKGEMSNAEILTAFALKNRRRMRETYLTPGLKALVIEYTIPDKPHSHLQKYRLTAMGKAIYKKNSITPAI